MTNYKGSQKLQHLLEQANTHLQAGRLAEAQAGYDAIIHIDMPLCRHRRCYIAAAHLGQAAIYIRSGHYAGVADQLGEAAMIYAMDGEHEMSELLTKLTDRWYELRQGRADTLEDLMATPCGAAEHDCATLALLAQAMQAAADSPRTLAAAPPRAIMTPDRAG